MSVGNSQLTRQTSTTQRHRFKTGPRRDSPRRLTENAIRPSPDRPLAPARRPKCDQIRFSTDDYLLLLVHSLHCVWQSTPDTPNRWARHGLFAHQNFGSRRARLRRAFALAKDFAVVVIDFIKLGGFLVATGSQSSSGPIVLATREETERTRVALHGKAVFLWAVEDRRNQMIARFRRPLGPMPSQHTL